MNRTDQQSLEEVDELLPPWARLAVSLISTVGIVVCLKIISSYVLDPVTNAAPDKVGIPTLLGILIAIVALTALPLQKMGIKVQKVFGVEFASVVQAQADERVREIAELRNQLVNLEKRVTASESSKGGSSNEGLRIRRDLEPLQAELARFLLQYRKWAFSPTRIHNWGASQNGFESLKDYSIDEIRDTLQGMVIGGKAKTSISRKGNTLFRCR